MKKMCKVGSGRLSGARRRVVLLKGEYLYSGMLGKVVVYVWCE